jgi:quercetin dioxygenase-like cupin family protein
VKPPPEVDASRRVLAIFYDHRSAPLTCVDEGPLRGLRHRTVIDRATGASSLALWQEEHLPGFRVPLHRHDCEEVIAVVAGAIRAQVGDAVHEVRGGQSILIPAWALHGFEVVSAEPVELLALFAASDPRIFRADGTPSEPPWRGGASSHLEDEPGTSP